MTTFNKAIFLQAKFTQKECFLIQINIFVWHYHCHYLWFDSFQLLVIIWVFPVTSPSCHLEVQHLLNARVFQQDKNADALIYIISEPYNQEHYKKLYLVHLSFFQTMTTCVSLWLRIKNNISCKSGQYRSQPLPVRR